LKFLETIQLGSGKAVVNARLNLLSCRWWFWNSLDIEEYDELHYEFHFRLAKETGSKILVYRSQIIKNPIGFK
jgi:hypothetical protein